MKKELLHHASFLFDTSNFQYIDDSFSLYTIAPPSIGSKSEISFLKARFFASRFTFLLCLARNVFLSRSYTRIRTYMLIYTYIRYSAYTHAE